MSEEKKKIKRTSIAKLLASYFLNREIFMKRVYTVRVDPAAKENKYMIITSEGFEIYDASKKVDVNKFAMHTQIKGSRVLRPVLFLLCRVT